LENKNQDRTTDHFIVIVGSGVDSEGRKYFQFFDNASNYVSKGANFLNRLYYDENTGIIAGKTKVTYLGGNPLPDYRLTQIRKSVKC
jgi:hypothetical protein